MAAIGERLHAAGSPFRRGVLRTVRRAWYAFTSVRTANVLLGAMLVGGLVGILVEQFGTSTLRDPALLAMAVQRLPERYGGPLAALIE